MCRWVLYYGDSILLADLLIEPNNSLLRQSEPERELYTPSAEEEAVYDPNKHNLRNHHTNGDGFGIAWYRRDYVQKISSSCFKSTFPAWNDLNMKELCQGIKSDLVMAHIRAASPGSVISRENCHPFKSGRYTFMHNGGVNGFAQIRRDMRMSLREDIYNEILGTSDSETCFAVFLNQLPNTKDLLSPQIVCDALHKTINIIISHTKRVGSGPSSLNFALTDGYTVVASRYRNCELEAPPALYIAHGAHFGFEDGEFHMDPIGVKDTMLISSEPLSKCPSEWKLISRNHLVLVTSENHPEDPNHKSPLHDGRDIRHCLRKGGRYNGELTIKEIPIVIK